MSNIRKIYYLNFAWAFLVVQAIMVPFYRSKGLTFEQIAIIGSVFSTCLLVLDLPTGYFADSFGRKRALVIAGLFKGLGGAVLYLWPAYEGFIFAFILIGIGNSLFSGTDVAMIYDEIKVANSISDSSALARRFQWGQLGSASSAIIGGVLAQHSLEFTVAVNAVVAWLSFLLALSLKDTPSLTPFRANHLARFWSGLKRVLTHDKRTKYYVLHRVFLSALLLIQVAYLQIFWNVLDIPLAWFGTLWAAHNLLSVWFSKLLVRWQARFAFSTTLTALIALPALGFLGSALALKLGAMGAVTGILFELERGLINGKMNAELNRLLPSDYRAFGNSIISLGSRFLFVLAAPPLGRLVDQKGLSPLFLILAGFTVLGGALFTYLLLKSSKSEDVPSISLEHSPRRSI